MSGMSLTYMDFLVSGVLATIMFGVGLSININDLKKILHSPKPFYLGLFAQMIILPVIALLAVYFTDLPPAIKVGFIILSACPGGTTSGFVTVLYRGNVALSVTSDHFKQHSNPLYHTAADKHCPDVFHGQSFSL